MKKKKLFVGILMASAVFGLAACGGDTGTTTSGIPTTTTTTTTQGGSTDPENQPVDPGTDPVNEDVEISTVEEFIAFRKNADNASKKVFLKNDIDLDGVTLEDTAIDEFVGEFDGQGYAIKNAVFSTSTAKIGILFHKVAGDGVVKNVRFVGCSATSSSESIGIIAGQGEGGTFSGIEFNACSATTSNTYSGLIYARNTGAAVINIDNITAKNGCFTSCSQYGGFLVSDMVAGTTVNFNNLDVEGEMKACTGNGSFIAGRVRGGNVNISNAIIKAKVVNPTNNGVLIGGGAAAAVLNCTNVVVYPSDADTTPFGKNSANVASYTFTNSYIVGTDSTSSLTTLAADSFTTDWVSSAEGLKLDFGADGAWMKEGENDSKYRLKASSTNVKSAGATLAKITLATGNAKLRFKKGEEFTTEGLIAFATYSDDVQLVMQSDEFTVDSSSFKNDTVGTYTITVKGVENESITKTYTVSLVEQTGFKINPEFALKTYAVGQDLDTANLRVYSLWSDQKEELLAAKDYTVTTTAYDKTTAGEYEISVTNKEYAAQTYKVTVVDSKPTVVDNYVYVNVDASSTAIDGTKVNGVETFKSVTAALDFLTACKFDSTVNKVVYVAAGTYNEKITTSLSNLHLIGAGESSIITYSAVESTVNVVKGTAYGLDCATLHVNGTGFEAKDIQIRNDFDYYNDNKKEASPQGLALTINGDGAVLHNVHLYGNQDTLYLKNGRAYFNECLIEGNIDFIFGQTTGVAFFENCEIKAIAKGLDQANNGYVTAMKGEAGNKPDYGYVFVNCNLTAGEGVLDGSMSLGRPWGAQATVSFINCTMSKAYSTLAYTSDDKTKSRWFSMSGNSPVNADFSEYGTKGDGKIEAAVDGGRLLSETEAANYTLANVLAQTNGEISFSLDVNFATELTELKGETTKVAATSITVTKSSYSIEKNKEDVLEAYVSPWNASSKKIDVVVTDPTVVSYDGSTLKGLKVGTTTITFTCGTLSETVTVEITAPSGTNTVKFFDGTTELTDLNVTAAPGDALTLPTAPAKTGFQFIGFYTDLDFSKKFSATEIPAEDTNVYLCYMELNKENVEYVSTADALVAAIAANKTIYLTSNIDMSTATTAYAGKADNFTGSVYGFDFEIQNWNVAEVSGDQISFFGKTYGGTLTNIVFADCSLKTDKKYTSILTSGSYADEVIKNITFKNCVIENKADAAVNTYSGLVAGAGNLGEYNGVSELTIKNITSINSSVTAGQYSGGLIGYLNKGAIKVDGLYGNLKFVSAGANAKNSGGVVGWAKNYVFTLTNANVEIEITGSASASQNLGGVLGGTQNDATATGLVVSNSKINVTAKDVNKVFGGLVGIQYATTTLNVTSTNVAFDIDAAGESLGGLAGRAAGTSVVNDVTLEGTIKGNYRTAGGFGYVNSADASVTVTNVTIGNLTITNSNADASVNTIYGKSDATNAIDVSSVSYSASKVNITRAETQVTDLQGTNTEA